MTTGGGVSGAVTTIVAAAMLGEVAGVDGEGEEGNVEATDRAGESGGVHGVDDDAETNGEGAWPTLMTLRRYPKSSSCGW